MPRGSGGGDGKAKECEQEMPHGHTETDRANGARQRNDRNRTEEPKSLAVSRLPKKEDLSASFSAIFHITCAILIGVRPDRGVAKFESMRWLRRLLAALACRVAVSLC